MHLDLAPDTMRTSTREAKSLVVFSDDWGRHPSSCQHLIQRLRCDHKVLWVNTIGTRSPKPNAFTFFRGTEKIKQWFRGVRQVSEQMWTIDAPMLPFIGGRISRYVNRRIVTSTIKRALKRSGIESPTIITTLPHVAWLVEDIGQRHTVYYCTDDYSQWPAADRTSLLAAERELQVSADLVLAVSDRLVSRNRQASKCVFFPHAVDFDHFAGVSEIDPHEEIARLPSPRIGFFGLIYEKLNFELLTALAKSHPHAALVMIGPVDFCPDEFRRLPNVQMVGQKPYKELPQWLAGLDVLLMPYVDDEMIRQSSPLKLKECLASGIPTVCVNLPEARKFEPQLRVANDRTQFLGYVKEALTRKASIGDRAERQALVAKDTWDARADQLRELLNAL